MTKGMRIKGLRLACVKKLTKAGLAPSSIRFGAHICTLDSNEPQAQLFCPRAEDLYFSTGKSHRDVCS